MEILDKEKILVVQTAFLGDAVLTLPIIQKLKGKFPDASLHILCIPSTKDLFEHSPFIDKVIVYDKRGKQKSLFSFVTLIRLIKDQNFTRVYSPHRSFRSSILVFFSGANYTAGFDNASCSFLYKIRVKYFSDKHEVARNLDLIEFDTSGENWRILPIINIPVAVETQINKMVEGISQKIVAVAPGSVWNTKIYPKNYFVDVIKYLVEKNYYVVLIGGKDDEKICLEIQANFNERVKSLVGQLSVIESAALLKKCTLLLSNDSAPTHLGMIANIPTITIYCSTVPEFGFFPYNQKSKSISLHGLECKPCGIHGHMECPIKTFECGKNLLPSEVIKSFRELISVEE